MQPHEQRVVDEKTELDTKCVALKKFTKTDIFNKLSSRDKELLLEQLKIMESYSLILYLRIDAFIK